jgi:3-hydroxyisobutyrate dehydrogenase-like beta-hydroxyacid dehydrogenase
VAALGELVGVIDRSPADLHNTLELLAELPVVSPALKRIIGLVEADTLDPNFTIDLVAKDLGYLVETANDLNIACPVASATREAFASAAHGDNQRADIAQLARLHLID